MNMWKNPVWRFPNAAIRRLMYKAGIKEMSYLSYEELRYKMTVISYNLLKSCISYMEAEDRKTLLSGDVRKAIEGFDMKLEGGEEDLKKCPVLVRSKDTNKKKKMLAKSNKNLAVEFYQEQSGCYYLPRTIFVEMMRFIADECNGNNLQIRFAKEALNMLQVFLETTYVGLGKDANMLAIHSGRQTVCPKDIGLASLISQKSPLFRDDDIDLYNNTTEDKDEDED